MMKRGRYVVESKGNYGYSEALAGVWQGQTGRTDGVTRSDGTADTSCHSIVKTADGGVLPSHCCINSDEKKLLLHFVALAKDYL